MNCPSCGERVLLHLDSDGTCNECTLRRDGLITNLRNANNAARIDLDAIKARAAAATEGPWTVAPVDDGRFYGQPPTFDVWDARTETVVGGGVMEDGGPYIGACESADAEFIAAARADVPALIAEVERLRAIEARP